MRKFIEKQKQFLETPVSFDKNIKSIFNWCFVAICSILFLTAFIGRFNFLTLVNVVLSLFVALGMFLTFLLKNKLNVFVLIGYSLLFFGSLFTYVCFGAEKFGQRLGYNLMISSFAIVFFVLAVVFAKQKNKNLVIASKVMAFCLIGATLSTFLFMSFRMKPTVESLKLGHDEYLANVKKNASMSNSDPNVLVILMDDMGYGDISSFSYMNKENATIKTPNIDRIGEMGIMMENCYASSPVSSPSRFGILTGRYSARGYLDNVVFPTCQQTAPFGDTRFFNPFEFSHNVDGILGDEITVAEAMQAKGYNTGLFGKWNLGDYGEYLPTNQGFDYFFGSHYVNDMTPYNIVKEQNGSFEEVYSHNDLLDQSMSTDRFTDELNSYIKSSVKENKKFFAEYWSPWPHFPIFSNNSQNGVGDKTDDNYIDCIQEFDSAVGKIMKTLETEGVLNDTMIIFTSDNGPGREGVSGALRGRKNTPFEGGHKVPLLACYPNSDLGKNVPVDSNGNKTIVSRSMNMDIFNTILDYADIEIPKDRKIDGVSLRQSWEGKIAIDSKLHDSLFYLKRGKVLGVNMPIMTEFEEWKVGANGELEKNVQTKEYDFKFYKEVQTENSAFFNQIYRNYLFNLDTDPAEGYNLSMKYSSVAKTLENELLNFRAELKNNRRGKML